MKTVILLLALLVSVPVFAQDTTRYALVVANNTSVDDGVPALRYADDDGARFFEIFSAYADQTSLLTTLDAESQQVFPDAAKHSIAPTRANLTATVESLKNAIKKDHAAGRRAEVFIVFTGHGSVSEDGEGYLSLANSKLRRRDLLKEVIEPLNADFTNVIIDACNAYFMVQSRGGWSDDSTGRTLNAEFENYLNSGKRQAINPTIGVILSTAGAQEVHEWSTYGGGVFSHQLRSALLGAADANADGAVSYPEIEAYLVAANAAVTNPRARIHVHVKGPGQAQDRTVIELKKLRNTTQLKILGGEGPMWIEDSRGLRYADLNISGDTTVHMNLLRDHQRGPYWIKTQSNEAAVPAKDVVEYAALEPVATNQTARGAVDEAFRRELFQTPFGPGFMAGFLAAKREETTRPDMAPQALWRPEFAVAYRLNRPILDVQGLQHSIGASAGVSHDTGWGVGGFVDYGFATDSSTTVHRISAGAQGQWATQVADVRVALQLRVGPEVLLFDAEVLQADPIALRGESNLVFAWNRGTWLPFVTGGVAVDVVTRAGVDANEEQVWLSPNIGAGVSF